MLNMFKSIYEIKKLIIKNPSKNFYILFYRCGIAKDIEISMA